MILSCKNLPNHAWSCKILCMIFPRSYHARTCQIMLDLSKSSQRKLTFCCFMKVADNASSGLPNVSLLDQHSELLKKAESMTKVFIFYELFYYLLLLSFQLLPLSFRSLSCSFQLVLLKFQFLPFSFHLLETTMYILAVKETEIEKQLKEEQKILESIAEKKGLWNLLSLYLVGRTCHFHVFF